MHVDLPCCSPHLLMLRDCLRLRSEGYFGYRYVFLTWSPAFSACYLLIKSETFSNSSSDALIRASFSQTYTKNAMVLAKHLACETLLNLKNPLFFLPSRIIVYLNLEKRHISVTATAPTCLTFAHHSHRSKSHTRWSCHSLNMMIDVDSHHSLYVVAIRCLFVDIYVNDLDENRCQVPYVASPALPCSLCVDAEGDQFYGGNGRRTVSVKLATECTSNPAAMDDIVAVGRFALVQSSEAGVGERLGTVILVLSSVHSSATLWFGPSMPESMMSSFASSAKPIR